MFDLEGSPSRPGSRQPLTSRPVVNGVTPGAPIYPLLKNSSPPKAPETPKVPEDVIIKMPQQPTVEHVAQTPNVIEVVDVEPVVEITVHPPEYNHYPTILIEQHQPIEDMPPAYNSYVAHEMPLVAEEVKEEDLLNAIIFQMDMRLFQIHLSLLSALTGEKQAN